MPQRRDHERDCQQAGADQQHKAAIPTEVVYQIAHGCTGCHRAAEVTEQPGKACGGAGRFLRREFPAGSRVHVFGTPALRKALAEEGFTLADEDVRAVVAGLDFEITFDKIRRAVRLIRSGARFIATNMDPNLPTEGEWLPGSGAMVAMLTVASEVEPTVIGKPEPIMYELAMAQMGARPETTAAVGLCPSLATSE